MHGLINRSIESFVTDAHGHDGWAAVAARAGLEMQSFEAMLLYDDALTSQVLDATSEIFARPREEIMEDIGTYLVANPRFEAVRRLLRFGGVDFQEFLHSLDDLPDRARMAVPELQLPRLELREHAAGQFSLICDAPIDGFGFTMMGVLRVMADDYGALALLDHTGAGAGFETLSITLVDAEFSTGRDFDLGARVA
ncbi:MAG: heme NO-binding domain-containing protein [Pseudomonadota bacterium]